VSLFPLARRSAPREGGSSPMARLPAILLGGAEAFGEGAYASAFFNFFAVFSNCFFSAST
jgi:hypothetical protein